MTEQWQELKETITEMRDNDGTSTQQEVCKFLSNLMDILEKQMQQQEPCEDAISRQAALNSLIDNTHLDDYDLAEALDAIENKEKLPPVTPKQRWIPVSELPRENGWYQCTIIVNDLPRTMELFYKNDKWLDNRRIDMFNTYDIYGYGYIEEKHKLSYQELISEFDWTKYVIAWMPLSEPYKAERSGEE